MKQLISVRALIRNDNKTLLLRRANGRESILGRYELPGGKLGYGEQPEDALARYIKDDAGLNIQTAQLFDVITYIDHDDRDIQYTFILYLVSLGEGGNKISLSVNYDHYIWKTLVIIIFGRHWQMCSSPSLLNLLNFYSVSRVKTSNQPLRVN